MRYRVLAVALLACACSTRTPPLQDPEAAANLKAQAAEVGRAMVQEDHGAMAQLSHPALVDHFGGRAGYIKKIEDMAADLRRQGLKFHAFRFGTPSKMIESSGDLYAILPCSLELTVPNGEPASQLGYWICTSRHRGANWKFLDGAGVGGDRRKLTRLLPRFPEDLPLPESQPLVVPVLPK